MVSEVSFGKNVRQPELTVTKRPTLFRYRYNNLERVSHQDEYVSKASTLKAQGNGSIGFLAASKNVLKGAGKFFTGMFCDKDGNFSVKQMGKTALVATLGGVGISLLPATFAIGGTLLSTAGVLAAGFGVLAGVGLGKSAYKAFNAKTNKDAENAWQNVGKHGIECVLAYIGYKASGGIFAKKNVTGARTSQQQTTTKPTTETTARIEPLSQDMVGAAEKLGISEADANFIHSAITRINNNRGNFSTLSVEEQSKFADVLGCRGIDLSHLSKAEYKKLMLKFHPDKYESQGGNDFAETIYKFIGEAYREGTKKAAA